MDMNDRALRFIDINTKGVAKHLPREDGFDITVASEVMAIFCLANNLEDLENRIANITIAYTKDNRPIFAKDLKSRFPQSIVNCCMVEDFNTRKKYDFILLSHVLEHVIDPVSVLRRCQNFMKESSTLFCIVPNLSLIHI
mgnify:CR=1 FL=1